MLRLCDVLVFLLIKLWVNGNILSYEITREPDIGKKNTEAAKLLFKFNFVFVVCNIEGYNNVVVCEGVTTVTPMFKHNQFNRILINVSS
jgi:hypothetical protein